MHIELRSQHAAAQQTDPVGAPEAASHHVLRQHRLRHRVYASPFTIHNSHRGKAHHGAPNQHLPANKACARGVNVPSARIEAFDSVKLKNASSLNISATLTMTPQFRAQRRENHRTLQYRWCGINAAVSRDDDAHWECCAYDACRIMFVAWLRGSPVHPCDEHASGGDVRENVSWDRKWKWTRMGDAKRAC